ncbi:MAG: hypothetical protein KZQ66_11060 [Candidatus Thiodiazotropha sp. (ex Lucinoma aequizonata)]|nr:hypothetical protein [Candidatus Thiodiazotropha sp. (ex Lucinoma aequizonata)]MCU7900011.1 hypothetical protein [Candidatus Thiodiazotropha sp. (ex Lucinoma aequizonata)]MCU7902463.1 hypothetical protein [Candidatus Thiodiazotropha sp. (ex Lucinoma aequizonata)]MCU7907267.1 hypothetical protein [Candidatus Thiodiazotropha sp. (ex Lucinoma aequizonata)]MCU7910768.1 hypothetical protein [Candidatus Thiodiazotropha sp. (ex Lucinoma aequizonata)]
MKIFIEKYEKIRPNINTGDLILFSGWGPVAFGIKLVTQSKWSHVGMAFKMPEYDFACVWESTSLSNIPDLKSGMFVNGVQMSPLRDRIREYNGEVAIRHLLDFTLGTEELSALKSFRHLVRGRPYERDMAELFSSALPLSNEEDISSLFCSELIAETYQVLGLLDESKPSNEYTPADFSQDAGLPLSAGALGEEIMITVKE